MPGLWKAWKAKGRLPTLPTSSLEISPNDAEIPTFPQIRRRRRMEKWKTKSRFSHFPTASIPLSQKNKRPSVVPFCSAAVENFHSALDSAIAESRKLKPEISFLGLGGRPIEDEVEFELLLDNR